MKKKFILGMNVIQSWYVQYMSIAKVYTRKWATDVIGAQNNMYTLTHDWFTSHVPSIAKQYDKAPQWTQKGLFYLPWFCLFLIILNYFNVFDRKPSVKLVQDPNIVILNKDLRSMITDGRVYSGSFVEELRASGRIDFNELFFLELGRMSQAVFQIFWLFQGRRSSRVTFWPRLLLLN